MYNLLKFVLLLTLFSCCTNNKKSDGLHINNSLHIVDLDKGLKRDTLFTSSIFKSVRAIPLETNNNSILGRINKFLIYKNNIFVIDINQARGLFMFDINGHFIRKIGGIGGGPGEYTYISDFTINPDKDEVIIVGDRKMFFFDIPTGQYKTTIEIQDKGSINSVQYYNGMLYTSLREYPKTSDDCLMQSVDLTTGKRVQKYLNTEEYNKGINEFLTFETPYFIPTGDPPFIFRHVFMDTFISLTTSGVQPYFTVKSKDFVTKKDLEGFEIQSNFIHESSKIFMLLNYFSNNDYISFRFQKKSEMYKSDYFFVFYNTNNKTTQIFDFFYNDLVYKYRDKLNMFFRASFFDKSGAYECVSSLSYLVNIMNADGIIDEVKEQLKDLDEESNPVIFYYEFK